MAVNLGSTAIANIYIGNTQVQNVYLGNALVYSASNPFTFTVNTANTSTGSSAANQFRLPLVSSFNGVTSTVDWGDGSSDVITAFDQAAVTHTYSASGTYLVKMTGAVRGFQFGNGKDKLKIITLSNYGQLEINTPTTFWGCTNLIVTATGTLLFTTTDALFMFRDCPNLGNINIVNWNYTSVVTSRGVFQNTTSANIIGAYNLNIRNVTNFQDFLANNQGLSTSEYDLLLTSWNGQVPKTVVTCSFGLSKYTLGSAAASARASLISTYGWTITDGGGI